MKQETDKLTPEEEVKINTFATWWFRRQADRDYIVARICYRNRLTNNFNWSCLQAIEKYLKAIFLYHRICVNDVSHNLNALIEELSELPFEIELSDVALKFISHINTFGMNRYFERPYFTHGPKLMELDRCIWEVRRFCRVWNPAYTLDPNKEAPRLTQELHKTQNADPRYPIFMRLDGGYLEALMEKREHPARAQLIWQNAYFSGRKRHTVRTPAYLEMENPPQTFYPETIEHVRKYVKVPKELRNLGQNGTRQKATRKKARTKA